MERTVKYTAPIRRVDTARGHHYVDATNARVPGVTTALDGGLPKKALINWAGTATAEAAVDRWDELAELGPAKRLKELQGARYAEKDKAAKRGTEVHGYAERLIHGDRIEVPEELAGHVEAYARFLDVFKVEAVAVEFGVASYKHGYAGTTDLIADIVVPRLGKKRLLLDLKTSRSGIFGEVALQLAAYRYADVIIGKGEDPETRMIEVEGCAGIHVRGDGADLVPVTADEAVFRSFLYVKQVYEFDKVSRDLVGAPIPSETESTYRLIRDEATA